MEPSVKELSDAVRRACQPTFSPYIIEGRKRILAMPRKWVSNHIVKVAEVDLNLSDYWEFGRFLELLDLIGEHRILSEFVATGLNNPDEDIRDIAECWVRRFD
jgi:hypothetical protein